MKANEYKEKLKSLMDSYVHFVYQVTRNFPKEELYNSVSQWRRSTLSIILNYVEGYARRKPLSQLNFYEISFASYKESCYLLDFSLKQKYIKVSEYQGIEKVVDEIGAMLWSEIKSLKKSIKE